MITIKTIKDIQLVINTIERKLENFTKRNLDMHGFRLINVGNSKDIKDVINRQEFLQQSKVVDDELLVLRGRISSLTDRVARLENP